MPRRVSRKFSNSSFKSPSSALSADSGVEEPGYSSRDAREIEVSSPANSLSKEATAEAQLETIKSAVRSLRFRA